MPRSQGGRQSILQQREILIVYSVVMISGLVGLGYQMSWTRMLSVALGHEFIAVLAVITAFFVGLALGGLTLNKLIKQTQKPVFWYVVLELVIGVWALLLITLMPSINQIIPQTIGSSPSTLWHWFVAFTATFFALLPATFSMGATMPAVERVAEVLFRRDTTIAGLYAANTFGAMLGIVISTYWLIPYLGINTSLSLFAVCNFAVAATAFISLKQARVMDVLSTSNIALDPVPQMISRRVILGGLFLTGLLGLGFEVVMVRVLAQILEGTVYTYAALLVVYLLGTSLGAAGYQWWLDSVKGNFEKIHYVLLIGLSGSCILSAFAVWLVEDTYRFVMGIFETAVPSAFLSEFSVASLVFLLPTLFMGALFSHFAQQAKALGGLGTAFAMNTFGAALAPLFFGVILFPMLGAKWVLVLISLAYLPLILMLRVKNKVLWVSLAPIAVAGFFILVPFSMHFVERSQNDELMHYEAGVTAAVSVIEEPDKTRHLKVNNHFTMGGTASRFSDHRQTHLPMLLQGGAAKNALYLGLGTGVTFQAAQFYPGLKATGVELIPELLELMTWFGVDVNGAHWSTKPRVLSADARRFVLADSQQYDVIIAEVFHPSRDGAGSLYTLEHFQAVRNRLSPQGVFCQWLPLFQLDLDVLKIIVRTYIDVFPNAQMHIAHYSLGQPLLCMAGGPGLQPFQPEWLIKRVHHRPLQKELVRNRLNSDYVLFGGFLGGAEVLRDFAGSGPLNLDDRPLVTYRAPRFVYGQPDLPAQRLIKILQQTASKRDQTFLQQADNNTFTKRLIRYWQARDIYLAAGVGVRSNTNIEQMYQLTGAKLLDSVATSDDFTAAYDSLIGMAKAIYRSDPQTSLKILMALESANKTLPDAKQLREQLFQ